MPVRFWFFSFIYRYALFQPILTRVYSHCNEKKFSLLWAFLLIPMSIFSHRDKYSWEMYFPQNTDIKTSSNIFLFKAEDSWNNRENTGKFIKNSGRILPPHLKINEKKRLLNKQELIKEISIKETGRTGQFAKIETKHLKNNKIEEENTKKQEEKRSISLSRTWYMVVSVFIIVNSSLVFWET